MFHCLLYTNIEKQLSHLVTLLTGGDPMIKYCHYNIFNKKAIGEEFTFCRF